LFALPPEGFSLPGPTGFGKAHFPVATYPLLRFDRGTAMLPFALEIGVAVLAFAILCAGAALLRNLLARRLQDTMR
jgi:hypothetical protein